MNMVILFMSIVVMLGVSVSCADGYYGKCTRRPSYVGAARVVRCGSSSFIGMDNNSIIFDGTFTEEALSANKEKMVYFTNKWDRKIRLRLPLGFTTIYEYPYALEYPGKTVVLIGSYSLEPGQTRLGIGDTYEDGVYEPSVDFIDTLLYRERLMHTTLFRHQGFNLENIRVQESFIFKDGKIDIGMTGYKEPLFYLSPAMKDRRAILHVKDGVFVLAYNIKERDYALFEAYIRDTFVVCSRYMDIVDAETLEYERRGASPNVVRSQYMEERFYREIPTVTPPDSAQIVEDAWRGTGLTPDLFRTSANDR